MLNHNPYALAHSGMSADKAREWLHADRGSPWKRADGGEIEPTSATEAPQAQAMIQRFSGMPGEALQELVVRLGPASPVGQLAQRVLRQKRIMPTSTDMGFGQVGGRGMPRPPAAPAQEDTLQPGLAALKQGVGGGSSQTDATGYAAGGMPHLGRGLMPLAAHDALRSMVAPPTRGFLAGPTPGRADAVMGKPAAGSYVIPADVVSHFGSGSSLAGAQALKAAFSSGPYGTSLPKGGGGRGPPRPPSAFHMTRGGKTPEKVDVALSDGEFVVSPEEVAAIGGGNIERGHKILDKLIVHARKKLISTLKRLPGPVKD